MSTVLQLNIQHDLHKCLSLEDIERVLQNYEKAFQNAVDASEFNHMVNSKKMELKFLQ